MSGYADGAYARSLDEFGTPIELSESGGWLLERPVPDSSLRDAMGCYPLFSCPNVKALGADLERLRGRLVSVVLVADPFLAWGEAQRRETFDHLVPWKDHYLVELSRYRPSDHHRYYARRARGEVRIERVSEPGAFLGDWVRLYGELTRRRGLSGIQAFSERSFRAQLEVPGIIAFRAMHGDTVVGGHLWYEQGEIAYSHLSATTEEGHRLLASYALYDAAIEDFRPRFQWLDLGGPAGNEGPDSGLAFFKRGWASETRTAWLCGKVLEPAAYERLAGSRSPGAYFPAYRSGELTGS